MSRATKLQKKYKACKSRSDRWLEGHHKQKRDSRKQGRIRPSKFGRRNMEALQAFFYTADVLSTVLPSLYSAVKRTP